MNLLHPLQKKVPLTPIIKVSNERIDHLKRTKAWEKFTTLSEDKKGKVTSAWLSTISTPIILNHYRTNGLEARISKESLISYLVKGINLNCGIAQVVKCSDGLILIRADIRRPRSGWHRQLSDFRNMRYARKRFYLGLFSRSDGSQTTL